MSDELKDRFKSLFVGAGFQITEEYELMNMYWPRNPAYFQMIIDNPWYLFKTQYGYIRVGWRKRVISLNWESTELRTIITEDQTTKDPDMVHAWTYADLSKYLFALKDAFLELEKVHALE